jgi:hypothetical protein
MSRPRPSDRLAGLNPEKMDPPPADTGRGRRSAAEEAFFEAMRAHRTATGRMFPSWEEVLAVLETLRDRGGA